MHHVTQCSISHRGLRLADGAVFGARDPCQAARIIGSILNSGLVDAGDRGQGSPETTGHERIPHENFDVHVGSGVVGVASGGRNVPNLNSFVVHGADSGRKIRQETSRVNPVCSL